MAGYTHDKDEHVTRLRKIEGQIRGLRAWSRTTSTASTS